MDHITQQCPPTIIEQYSNIMLSADIMHVNRIPFFVTRSCHIHFGTVDVLPSLQATDIEIALSHVLNIYARGGFQVTTALRDEAFAGLHDVCNQPLTRSAVYFVCFRPTYILRASMLSRYFCACWASW